MISTARPVSATTTLQLPGGGELEAALVRKGSAWSLEVEWPRNLRSVVAPYLPITWGTIIESRNRCEIATKLGTDLPITIALVRDVLGQIQQLPPTSYWFASGTPAEGQVVLRFEDLDPMWHWSLTIERFETDPFASDDPATFAFMAALQESKLCSAASLTDTQISVELTPDAITDYLGAMAALAELYMSTTK